MTQMFLSIDKCSRIDRFLLICFRSLGLWETPDGFHLHLPAWWLKNRMTFKRCAEMECSFLCSTALLEFRLTELSNMNFNLYNQVELAFRFFKKHAGRCPFGQLKLDFPADKDQCHFTFFAHTNFTVFSHLELRIRFSARYSVKQFLDSKIPSCETFLGPLLKLIRSVSHCRDR